MGPLLTWGTRIIENFGPDVAARHHTRASRPAPSRTRHDAMSPSERTARLHRLLSAGWTAAVWASTRRHHVHEPGAVDHVDRTRHVR
jgi:hypothetical protein